MKFDWAGSRVRCERSCGARWRGSARATRARSFTLWRSTVKTAAKRILPALAERLGDRHRIVRRFAVVAVSLWKAAAKPYFPQIKALTKDRDAIVRHVAKNAVSGN